MYYQPKPSKRIIRQRRIQKAKEILAVAGVITFMTIGSAVTTEPVKPNTIHSQQ